jgi:recA bacterial DNA recombination protein
MNQALAKAQIEAKIRDRFGPVFNISEKRPAEYLSSGLAEIDALTGGLPRGAITEIVGSVSSGRMSLLLAAFAHATSNSETVAIIDTSDSFDPASAANSGVDVNQLLWVRCDKSLERAFKATDLLLQSGGFGFVALNLAEVAANNARRILSSWWFRFRRAIENTPTTFVVISPAACVRSCASMILEMRKTDELWRSTLLAPANQTNLRVMNDRRISFVGNAKRRPSIAPKHARLLTEVDVQVKLAKPTRWTATSVQFQRARSILA